MAVPYYPLITETPNLGLSLVGMDEVIAQDMVLIDDAFGAQKLPFQTTTSPILASGNNIVSPAEAGKKKIIQSFGHNPTVGSISVFSESSPDGGVTWFKTNAVQAVAPNATVTISQSYNPYGSDMTYGINATAPGLNLTSGIQVVPDTFSLTSKFITSWVVGNNTLLTVPDGQVFFLNNNGFNYFNSSGSTTSIAVHFVPPGGSPSLTNRVFFSASVLTDAIAFFAGFATLPAGYKIIVVSNSAGKQFAGMSGSFFNDDGTF